MDTTLTLLRRDALELPSLAVHAHTPSGELQVPLGLEPITVGTAPECELCIADDAVSRRHCRLTLGERGITLRDLGSKNGTYVREVPVIEAPLAASVPVSIGSSRLWVEVAGAPRVVALSLAASFGAALGGSLAMRMLFAQLEQAAPSDISVLLRGDSGTGKELLARAIHDKSPRRDGPFEVLDCAAAAPQLFEAELFGYERGAFTGADRAHSGVLQRADGGTLFIDEIGELPLELQPKLLRALETRQVLPIGASSRRPFDARIVCATHADLAAMVRVGSFREDLFFRLAVVRARVPALSQRKDDIPLLVERFLADQSPPLCVDDLPPGAMALLVAHDWPGNVRELHNALLRMVVFRDLDALSGGVTPAIGRLPLREARALVLEHFEREYIGASLREHGGNVTRAAKHIGVSRQLLHRLMDRHDIKREAGS